MKSSPKDIRRGVSEQKERPNLKGRRPVKKPWCVMFRDDEKSRFAGGRDFEMIRCATENEAQKMIEKFQRSLFKGSFWIKNKQAK